MRHIVEETLPQVSKQRERFAGQGGDEQALAPVVIEIAEIGAHRGNRLPVVVQRHPSFEGDFRELPPPSL